MRGRARYLRHMDMATAAVFAAAGASRCGRRTVRSGSLPGSPAPRPPRCGLRSSKPLRRRRRQAVRARRRTPPEFNGAAPGSAGVARNGEGSLRDRSRDGQDSANGHRQNDESPRRQPARAETGEGRQLQQEAKRKIPPGTRHEQAPAGSRPCRQSWLERGSAQHPFRSG